jgi:MATE family multidrug resistance protein
VLVAQLAVIASGVLDTIMSGRYSAVDLAAVGIGASVYFSIFIGLLGVVQALSPIAAQLFGGKHYERIGEETRQTAWLALGLAALGVALLAHPEPFLRLSSAPPEVEAKTRAYLQGIAWALPAMLLFRVFFALTTAVSRPRAVMLINLVYFALKVPLNALFIYGALGAPELGGPGCAVATAIASWLICAIAWVYCAKHPFYAPFGVFSRWSWPDWRAIWAHLRLGVPMGLSFFVEVTSFTFMALFLARLGAATSAGHQIASNATAVVYMFGLAIGNATGVLTAQALGAGDPREARHTGLIGMGIMFAISACAAVTILLGAHRIVFLYTHDGAVIAIATRLMAFVAFYQLFDTAQDRPNSDARLYPRALGNRSRRRLRAGLGACRRRRRARARDTDGCLWLLAGRRGEPRRRGRNSLCVFHPRERRTRDTGALVRRSRRFRKEGSRTGLDLGRSRCSAGGNQVAPGGVT